MAPTPADSYDDRYLEFVDLWNRREFYDAHEALEDLWLDDDGPDRRFHQGLIHLAAAYLHLWRGNVPGARARLASGAAHLHPYGDIHRGLDLAVFHRVARTWLVNETPPPYDDHAVPHLVLCERPSPEPSEQT